MVVKSDGKIFSAQSSFLHYGLQMGFQRNHGTRSCSCEFLAPCLNFLMPEHQPLCTNLWQWQKEHLSCNQEQKGCFMGVDRISEQKRRNSVLPYLWIYVLFTLTVNAGQRRGWDERVWGGNGVEMNILLNEYLLPLGPPGTASLSPREP